MVWDLINDKMKKSMA